MLCAPKRKNKRQIAYLGVKMNETGVGADVFFVLVGAILVFAMHGGFAFLEVGTVRQKNQVNALVKILVDFALSTVAYFFVGYAVAYGTTFLVNAATLSRSHSYHSRADL